MAMLVVEGPEAAAGGFPVPAVGVTEAEAETPVLRDGELLGVGVVAPPEAAMEGVILGVGVTVGVVRGVGVPEGVTEGVPLGVEEVVTFPLATEGVKLGVEVMELFDPLTTLGVPLGVLVGETVGLGVIPPGAEGSPEGVGVNRTEAVRLLREDVDAEGEKVAKPPQGNR